MPYLIDYKRLIPIDQIKSYKNNFHIGRRIKIKCHSWRKRGLKKVEGIVLYKTDYFITLLIKGKYKESYKYIDFIVGDIEIL